jgi:hypothetical protein
MKTVGAIRGPAIRVSDSREWASGYWIKPEDLKERFIAVLSKSRKEYWMLAFDPEDEQPWYFLGDYGMKGSFSEWFGFRVFGETVFSEVMPMFSLEKGTKWTGTIRHVMGSGKGIADLSAAYQKSQNHKSSSKKKPGDS